jgi:hypothetical protein
VRGLLAVITFVVAFSLSPKSLFAQLDTRSTPTVKISGEARETSRLVLTPESTAEPKTEYGDFFVDTPPSITGQGGGIELKAPFRFNRQRSSVTFTGNYRAIDLRFDEAPFAGREFGSRDWLHREVLLESEIFDRDDFSDYRLPERYSDWQLPDAAPSTREEFRWEDLAQRRYDQVLLDSSGLPLLAPWHPPVERSAFYLERFALTVGLNHKLGDSVFLFANVTPTGGREVGAKARAETSFLVGSAGVGFITSKRFSLGVGAYYTDTFGDPTVSPVLFLTYKPTDRWELNVNFPSSASTKFWLLKQRLNVSMGAELYLGAYGLVEEKNQLYTSGMHGYIAMEVFAGDGFIVELKAGRLAFTEYSLHRRGRVLYTYAGSDVGFARLSVTMGLYTPGAAPENE